MLPRCCKSIPRCAAIPRHPSLSTHPALPWPSRCVAKLPCRPIAQALVSSLVCRQVLPASRGPIPVSRGLTSLRHVTCGVPISCADRGGRRGCRAGAQSAEGTTCTEPLHPPSTFHPPPSTLPSIYLIHTYDIRRERRSSRSRSGSTPCCSAGWSPASTCTSSLALHHQGVTSTSPLPSPRGMRSRCRGEWLLTEPSSRSSTCLALKRSCPTRSSSYASITPTRRCRWCAA